MDLARTLSALIAGHYFVDAIYQATKNSTASRAAAEDLLLGVACCGCVAPIADAQRLLEGVDVRSTDGTWGGLRVHPQSELPLAGLDHIASALRAEPGIQLPGELVAVAGEISDDLAYASRRETHRAPDERRGVRPDLACLAASILLRQLTGRTDPPPGAHAVRLEAAAAVIKTLVEPSD